MVPEPSNSTDEGFLTKVHRDGVIRGPFKTIQEAITAAHTWNQELVVEAGQSPQQAGNEAHVVVNTISESVAVHVESPADNPPVIEPTASTTDTSNSQHPKNEVSREA